MIKMIFGAKRRAGMSRDDFGRYWTTRHASIAMKVPGIKRYVINLAPDLSGSGSEQAYDGFAEAWFDDLDDMRAASRSDEIKAVLRDEENLFDPSTRFTVVVEEHVMIGDNT
jgi:uncharacterized protein (TIGR02118 family)